MLIDDPVFLSLVATAPGADGQIVAVRAERRALEDPAKSNRIFERLARPAGRVTRVQAKATGLDPAQLDAAPELDEVLEDLLGFSEGASAWIVAGAEEARRSLNAVAASTGFAVGFGPAVVGIEELGGLVHPERCRHGVSELLVHYAIEGAASPTPATLRALWERLEADLLRLPLPLLAEMNWLLTRTTHPLKGVLKRAEKDAVATQFSGSLGEGKLSLESQFKDFSEFVNRLGTKEEEDVEETLAEEPESPVPLSDVRAFLGPGGPLAQALDSYEDRPEQIEMAERVAAALNDGRHLLAEAGTGVGKSLAYLAPAVMFSKAAGRPLVISTHTKNLQSQLFHKDLPLLRRALNEHVEVALLKGRSNYLCARKFMYTLQEAAHELGDEERAALLPVMTWATRTQDGDVAELAAFAPEMAPELWDRLHTVGEDCLARQCPFYKRCFVYKARGAARTADLVVCNHALVFADLHQDHGALPPYREVVFDEAHTLEDVATDHLACEITPRRVYRLINRLFRAPKGSPAGKGLLPALLFQLEQAREDFPPGDFESIHSHVLEAIQAVGPASTGADLFFDQLREWLDESGPPADDDRPEAPYVPRERGRRAPGEGGAGGPNFRPRSGGRGGEQRRRYGAQTLRPEEAERLQAGKEAAVAGLGRLRQALERMDEDFKEIRKRRVPRARELSKEIGAQDVFLQELISDLEFVAKADEPNYVYWTERFGRRAIRVVAAPLDIAPLLYDQLYKRKRSVILTSATLSVRYAQADAASGFAPLANPLLQSIQAQIAQAGGEAEGKPHRKSFEFIKQRLGVGLCEEGKLDELLEGSPFDYPRQARLYVPTFLPEAGGQSDGAFNDALTGMVAQLAAASEGRAMVLYTSYAALRAAAPVLRKALAGERIEVVAQAEDGSREAILERLKAGGRTVLLGTASFWQGVDVPGAALSLLVIAKLPFQVFTDPLVQGRCELLEAQGKDPFLHYSVPHAILRLRQGFGRLIRSKNDRGVVVLCDKRVLTKRYGPAFLRALPIPPRRATEAAALAGEVRAFLSGEEHEVEREYDA